MTNLNDMLRRCAVVVVFLGLSACSGGVEEGTDEVLGTSEALLACSVSRDCATGTQVTCSSADGACTSGPESGGWVRCDGNAAIYCPPACSCGSTRYTVTRGGQGSTCGAAYAAAMASINSSISSRCPSGGCNISRTNGACTPVGSGRDEGFNGSVTVTYSCNEPVGCSG